MVFARAWYSPDHDIRQIWDTRLRSVPRTRCVFDNVGPTQLYLTSLSRGKREGCHPKQRNCVLFLLCVFNVLFLFINITHSNPREWTRWSSFVGRWNLTINLTPLTGVRTPDIRLYCNCVLFLLCVFNVLFLFIVTFSSFFYWYRDYQI
jgi:hypothetical protein